MTKKEGAPIPVAAYVLVKQKDVKCAGDRFTMMLFKNPDISNAPELPRANQF